ncbi:hypothetical protein PPYR_02803 [Photinus pyralis]|uniref:Peptidase S1 domain-containing protein n=1 Tax=Photinus pyralis TaxID=7054 RepID=A0A1Y1MAP3_PHOPY|nr:serine protease gd-like [Photinus pyralis]KAB0791003.1 hypothetical protein PPYR_02803 [Photinus pyralis]
MNFLNRHYLLQISTYLILFALVRYAKCQLQSPCPNVFEYRYGPNRNLYGYIDVPVPSDDSNVIRLDVQLSVGNRVEGGNGLIKLAEDEVNVIQNVIQKRRMQYILHFPAWSNVPPRVTRIQVNGRVVCIGDPISRFQVSVLTTINLVHTLTLSVPLTGSSGAGIPIWRPDNGDRDIPLLPTRRPPLIQPEVNRPFDRDDFWNDVPQIPPPRRPPTTRRPPPIRPAPPTRNEESPRPSWEVYPEVESITPRRPPASSQTITCGVPSITNSLIVNGRNYTNGAHPWLGALFVQNNDGLKFICGSTLISKRHVLTAAHCIRTRRKRYRPDELWVVLGRENIRRWSNDGAQIIQTESLHIHPDFRFTTADGDISLIALAEEAVFSTFVRPACLWSGSADPRLLIASTGVVVGWGKDEHGQLVTSSPRQVIFPVVSEEDCLRSNNAFREITSNRTFCAGFRNNSGPCNGDSGGGFLMLVEGQWTLRGIVSMSLITPDGNCDLRQYVVFTDIARYLPWLLPLM